MDGNPTAKAQLSPSQSHYQTKTPSGQYSSNPLGINTSPANQHARSGSYTAYSPTNVPPVLSPLAQPVTELDGTTSSAQPFGYAPAARRPEMDRHNSCELSSTNSVRANERSRQTMSPLARSPGSPGSGDSYNRPSPPAPSGGWINH